MAKKPATTIKDLLYKAWEQDIEPEDVVRVLHSEGQTDVTLTLVRAMYRKWYQAFDD